MLGHLLPLALILAYGAVFAWRALGPATIAFDDHPGQLYRVWHVVTHGPAPWAWNPGWWTGYPELQFYPPGFAYLAALIHLASRDAVSVIASYQIIVWLAYLAPAVTVWLLLRRVHRDGWLALPGAFLALTLSAGLASGVEGGVHIGMVAARLGWAALPLVPLALEGWMAGRRAFPWAVPPLVAGIVLTHPAHAPAAAVVVLLAAWLARRSRRHALRDAGAALLLAAGLTAFWSLPLLAHASETRALAWGAIEPRTILADPLLLALLALALGVVVRAARPEPATPLVTLLSAAPWAMAAVVVVDALGLEPLGLRWLPSERVADSAWLGFVIAAGMVAGRLIALAAGPRPRARAALAGLALGAAALLGLPNQTLTLWPRAAEWPRFATIALGMRLDALWTALGRAPDGRVLFVRSGVPLAYGPAHWRLHSHVTALTPLITGRGIVNGTFTHPSPVAALLYRGDAGRGAIRELAERLDGHRLFGREIEMLDAETFNGYAEPLGISAVVALDEDVPRLRALRDNPLFADVTASPPFAIYSRRTPATLPAAVAPDHLRATLDGNPGTWVSLHLAYYPLWHATVAGHPIPTRRGSLGDLEAQLPSPRATIDLRYTRGPTETLALLLSTASTLLLAATYLATLRRP